MVDAKADNSDSDNSVPEQWYLDATAQIRELKAENERLHDIFKSVGVPMTARAFMAELDDLKQQRAAYLALIDQLQTNLETVGLKP